MKKHITYLFITLNVFGFSQECFKKFYNDDGNSNISFDRGFVIREYNNSYFVLGEYVENLERHLGLIDPNYTYTTDTTRVLLINIDKKGNEIFNKNTKIYSSCWAQCTEMVINKNGITTAAAYFTSGSYCGGYDPMGPVPPGFPGNQDCLIMQSDFNGNVKWITTFGNTEKEGVWGLQESNNNGYFALCATTQSYSTYLVELNQNGDSVRRIDLTFNRSDHQPTYFAKTTTGFIVFYQVTSLAQTRAIIMNNNGDTISSKIIPMYKPRWFKPTKDGGFIVVQLGTNAQTTLFKLDKDLNLEWTNTFNVYASNMVNETADGNYIIGFKDFAKVDNKGNVIWKKRFFGESNITPWYYFYDGIQTSDGGFIMTGFHESNTFVIKTDCNGNIEWDNNACILPTDNDVLVFPNPFYDNITFQLPNVNKDVAKISLRITDLLGQVLTYNNYENKNIISLNLSTYAQGVYIYSIFVNDKVYKSDKIFKK
jgi:hypothetical protein